LASFRQGHSVLSTLQGHAKERVGINNRIEREIYKLMLEEKADKLEAEYK
jgi:hypothetical protein